MWYWQKLSLSLVVVGSLLWLASPAIGQEASNTQASDKQAVNDDQLRTFAKVYVAYQRIRQQYEPALKNAQEPERKRIQDEANSKVKTALSKQNLTAEEYNRIFAQVNGNADLRRRALKLIDGERKKG
jgi:Domain of unknown function (DUF4168)